MTVQNLDLSSAVSFFREHDHYIIVSHSSPDGDTLGAAFGLCGMLRMIGKEAAVVNGDEIPPKFRFMGELSTDLDPTGKTVVTVDVADRKLAKGLPDALLDATVLSIDHHPSHVNFAPNLLLDAGAAACAEIITDLVPLFGIALPADVATALYTGIATDTGCFLFTNVTPKTHRAAAFLMENGADVATVNRTIFETKTKGKMRLETIAMERMEYHFEGLCALTTLEYEDIHADGTDPDDLSCVASLPRTVEGVLLGVTLKGKEKGKYSVSVRSFEPVDASAICARLGGGGHVRAAGCEVDGDAETVKTAVLASVKEELLRIGAIR